MKANPESSRQSPPPRLIVNIASGPELGRKAVLAPGQELRIGRAPGAELSIPGDSEMAGHHLVLRGTEAGYRVRDLGSLSGTWLDGVRVEEAPVEHAAWLRAGATDLLVCHEGWAYAHAAPPSDTPAGRASKTQALERLRARTGPLYAVVDTARDGWVLQLLRESSEELSCLLDPPEAQTLFRVAPFLVALAAPSALLTALVHLGWGQSWGIYLEYDRPLARLREHLRQVLDSTNPDTGKPAYLRFYDPRVLGGHVSGCTVEQRAEFFGDIRCFLAESESGELECFER